MTSPYASFESSFAPAWCVAKGDSNGLSRLREPQSPAEHPGAVRLDRAEKRHDADFVHRQADSRWRRIGLWLRRHRVLSESQRTCALDRRPLFPSRGAGAPDRCCARRGPSAALQDPSGAARDSCHRRRADDRRWPATGRCRGVSVGLFHRHQAVRVCRARRSREAPRLEQRHLPATSDYPSTGDFFRQWVKRRGFPFVDLVEIYRQAWSLRGHENVLLLHYNEIIQDLPAAVRRIAAFERVDLTEARIQEIVALCRFDEMRRQSRAISSESQAVRHRTPPQQGHCGARRGSIPQGRVPR